MDVKSLTLTEFLLARIAEDDADGWVASGLRAAEYAETRAHRECEAKRAIVENCNAARSAADAQPLSEQVKSSDGPVAAYWRGQNWACRTLAAVYVDHPDYRDEWRP